MARRPPPAPRVEIRMRSVVAGPYREALQARDLSSARKVTEVVQALGAIAELRMKCIGSLVMLAAPGDERTLNVMLTTDDQIALAGVKLTGQNDLIAIRVACALVPLFGAIELCVGEEAMLIDGTESADALIAKRMERIREHIDAVAEAFNPLVEMFESAPFAAVTAKIKEAEKKRSKRELKQLALLMFVIVGGLALYFAVTWLGKATVGEGCTRGGECRSGECLPREAVRPLAIGGTVISTPRPTSSAGVCTSECHTDADCPSSMKCETVLQTETLGGIAMPGATRVLRCAPLTK